MIERLTEEQELMLREEITYWLKIGRSTERLDIEKAKKPIIHMYRAIGKEEPSFMLFSSPAMCVLAWGALHSLAKEGGRSQLQIQLGSQLQIQLDSQLVSQLDSQLVSQLQIQLDRQLGSQLVSQLWSQLDSQLVSQLGSQLVSQLWSQLWSQLDSQLVSQLDSQLVSQLGSQLDSQLVSQLGSQVYDNMYSGDWWSGWKSFYHFAHRIGVHYEQKNLELLEIRIEESRNAHFWFPYDGLVLLSDRPTKINLDYRGRLHSTSEMAISYSDGWGFYSIHGVRVTSEVVEKKDELTPANIEKETNQEVRRAMLDLYGMDRYLKTSGAKQIHKDKYGELYEKKYPDGDIIKFVKVMNSTPEPDGSFKDYFLFTDREVRTAHQAVALSFGMTPEEYEPLQET